MRSAKGSESTSRRVPVRPASPGSALMGGTVELEAACEGAMGGNMAGACFKLVQPVCDGFVDFVLIHAGDT